MASVLASEDQRMPDAAAESREDVATKPDETYIDIDDQRIRLVSKNLSQFFNAAG